jgi:uncharacterized protein
VSTTIEAFFHRLGSGDDVDGWLDLLADDVVVSTPFAPFGSPREFVGKAAVTDRFAGSRRRFASLDFLDLEILATEDEHRWVATCRSEGERLDGRHYRNRYCWIIHVRDERVVAWTEYFDPQEVIALRTDPIG